MGLLAKEKREQSKKIVTKKGTKISLRSMAAVEVEQTEVVHPAGDGRTSRGKNNGANTRPDTPKRRPGCEVGKVNLENWPTYIHQRMVLG